MDEPRQQPGAGGAAVERVATYLRARAGYPICSACLAKALALPGVDVRTAISRLMATGRYDLMFWWCVHCGTKTSVTIALKETA